MSLLNLENKTFLIMGMANKKSIASFVAELLLKEKAQVIFSAQSEEHAKSINKLFPEQKVLICDVTKTEDIQRLGTELEQTKLDGFLHSIAFGQFRTPHFHETSRADYLEATQISQFSLVEVTHSLLKNFNKDASIVTISISNTKATSYGYLGPIKAMLEATVPFLAKSTGLRVNAIASGPLKTSASAGIPNYIENYLFAEAMTLRKKALLTDEVAKSAIFLLSQMSSGINGTSLLVDAGMHCNVFDEEIIQRFHGVKK
jgi:enoyl-[acyl-carrier protein] reductase I